MSVWQGILSAAFVVLLLPPALWWGLWLFYALLAALPARARKDDVLGKFATGVTIDILIPAHNEEILLPRLLETLRLQTSPQRIGRIIVVADHCTDRTASLSRQAHAEVFERFGGPRGKPAALRDGIARLRQLNGAEADKRALLILDADCTVSPNLVEHCARALDAGAPVVQAAYVLEGGRAQNLHSAAQIAFALKNVIRPRGMMRLGLPTQLFGTGMCFRGDIVPRVQFADHLTEDLAISYELLSHGIEARFLPAALVRSPLPGDRGAMTTQKLRWEAGQVHTWTRLPAMLLGRRGLLIRGKLRAALSVLDWSAPPVAMALLYWAGVSFAVVLAIYLGWASPWVLALSVGALLSLFLYVVIGGMQISRAAAVGRLFLAVPRFFLWKIGLYAQMLAGRGPGSWQRTPRSISPGGTPVVLEEAARTK